MERMRLWLTLLLAWPISVPATPTFSPCLWGFATLPDDTKPNADLVARTYGDLLAALGKGVTPETWKKLAESEDPFGLPEQPGTDLGGLRKNLREFERLLTVKGWVVPEIRPTRRGHRTVEAAIAG